VDIAEVLGCDQIVLWLAREGTYIRESKNARQAQAYILDALKRDARTQSRVRIMIEPKPNEPMDHTYVPTIGMLSLWRTRRRIRTVSAG